MSEKKGGVELIERLLNPMWAHSNMPFESPQLEQEENLAAMRDAAKEIQRLLAIPDAAQERIRVLTRLAERAAERFEKIRIILIYHLEEPERRAFWEAVQGRDELTSLSTARPIPEKEDGNPALPVDAIVNLVNHQQQCDEDGVMVQVSRQALCEVLAYITEMRPDNKWAARKEEGK